MPVNTFYLFYLKAALNQTLELMYANWRIEFKLIVDIVTSSCQKCPLVIGGIFLTVFMLHMAKMRDVKKKEKDEEFCEVKTVKVV